MENVDRSEVERVLCSLGYTNLNADEIQRVCCRIAAMRIGETPKSKSDKTLAEKKSQVEKTTAQQADIPVSAQFCEDKCATEVKCQFAPHVYPPGRPVELPCQTVLDEKLRQEAVADSEHPKVEHLNRQKYLFDSHPTKMEERTSPYQTHKVFEDTKPLFDNIPHLRSGTGAPRVFTSAPPNRSKLSSRASNVIYAFTDDRAYCTPLPFKPTPFQPPRGFCKSDPVKHGAEMRALWAKDSFLTQKNRKKERWEVRRSMMTYALCEEPMTQRRHTNKTRLEDRWRD